MKISLIHPSRGRAKKSYANAMDWIHSAGCETQLIVSVDLNDEQYQKYVYEYRYLIREENASEEDSHFALTANQNTCVVQATNRGAMIADGDILIYLSDDFKCFRNWGEAVIKEFEGVTEPMLLKVHDNLQNFSARVLTIPIMNRALYEKLGYFFHPEYKSMWVDCDLFETCTKIGAIKNAPHLIFSHEHHSIGKADNDETYKRSEANWNQGLAIFNRRRREGFKI